MIATAKYIPPPSVLASRARELIRRLAHLGFNDAKALMILSKVGGVV